MAKSGPVGLAGPLANHTTPRYIELLCNWFLVKIIFLSSSTLLMVITLSSILLMFSFTANQHHQLLRLFQQQPACPLFPLLTPLHPHWLRPFLKGMVLHLSPQQLVQEHRIVHQGHHLWQATVAPHIGLCLLTPSPLLQLPTHPLICLKMDLWTQMSLIHTTDFYMNISCQNFRRVNVFVSARDWQCSLKDNV